MKKLLLILVFAISLILLAPKITKHKVLADCVPAPAGSSFGASSCQTTEHPQLCTNGLTESCCDEGNECKSPGITVGAPTGGSDEPFPRDTTIACNEVSSKEFHSLRPYQANIECTSSEAETAEFCGNTLTLRDSIEVYYPGTPADDCQTSGGKVTCTYTITKNRQVEIDLSDARLPFMGLTEADEITNSQNTDPDTLSDAGKVNSYVSWYLNGSLFRAEYEYPIIEASDPANSLSYAGPLNKLLPQEIQFKNRIDTIEAAEKTRHDQIVGCNFSATIDLLGSLGIPGAILSHFTDFGKIIAADIPYPCYDHGLAEKILTLVPGITIKQHRLSEWKDHEPPLRSNPVYPDFISYWKAYREWQGNSCAIISIPDDIPLLGGKKFLVCVRDVTEPRFYSILFPYVPMSSTEDIQGQIVVDSLSPSTTGDVSVSNVTFSNQTPADLFYSHVEEADQLANHLQDTYAPLGADKTGTPSDIDTETACTQVTVRTNKGDNLFATSIKGDLSYTATFSCIFDAPPTLSMGTGCDNCKLGVTRECATVDGSIGTQTCVQAEDCIGRVDAGNWGGCLASGTTTPQPQTCTKTISIGLTTKSKVPLLDQVWSRLVAGPMAIFKRIFPKTNVPNEIGQIIDIPGSTNIKYTGTDIGVSQAETYLNLPHIGGISEYFLKGIQTALRPKGYGEPLQFGTNPLTQQEASASANCDTSAPEVSLPNTISKQATYDLAVRWLSGDTGNQVLECYNDVVKRALENGINPALAIWVWLHESNASNYSAGYLQDFGAAYPAPVGFVAQINEFFARAKRYTKDGALCNNDPLIANDLVAFTLIYRSGTCDPALADLNGKDENGNFYRALFEGTQWSWVTSCPLPTSPSDMGCY